MNKKLIIIIAVISILILLVKGFGFMKEYRADKKFEKIAYTLIQSMPDNTELYEQVKAVVTDTDKKQQVQNFQQQTDQLVRLIENELTEVEQLDARGEEASVYLLSSGKAKQLQTALKKLNGSAGELLQDQNYESLTPEKYLTAEELSQGDSWARIMFASVPNSVVKVWLLRFKHDIRTEEKYALQELKSEN